jgi:hypothetical protein
VLEASSGHVSKVGLSIKPIKPKKGSELFEP